LDQMFCQMKEPEPEDKMFILISVLVNEYLALTFFNMSMVYEETAKYSDYASFEGKIK